jgi:hypothetical protein
MQLTETRLQEVTRAPEASLLPARSWAGIILLVFMICGAIAIAFDAAPQPTNEAALSEFSAVRKLILPVLPVLRIPSTQLSTVLCAITS